MPQVSHDEQKWLFVTEVFIHANRALLDGVESAMKGLKTVEPHYCSGADCRVHRDAVFGPLSHGLEDNANLGEFITEVVSHSVQPALKDAQ
jgi:hypothetical protein